MSETRESRSTNKGGSTIRFDVAYTLEEANRTSSALSDIVVIEEQKSSTKFLDLGASDTQRSISPGLRGQDSLRVLGTNHSLSFSLDRMRNSDSNLSPTFNRRHLFPKPSLNLEATKTLEMPLEDVANVGAIDFDETVYRTDDGNSDEEFLDKRFLEDLQKRINEREQRKEDIRKRTRVRELRSGNSGEKPMQNRASTIAAEAKENIVQEVLNRRNELPNLQGFLEKLSPALHSRWQRRWVAVVDYTIFYFKEEGNITSKKDAEEHGYLNMLPLTTVSRIAKDDKAKRGEKFDITARDPRTGDHRHYKWRCKDAELCNYWVQGLVQHKDQALSELKIGARSRLSVHEMTRKGNSVQNRAKKSS